jgi:DNA-binding MarR family transcriptional regulator
MTKLSKSQIRSTRKLGGRDVLNLDRYIPFFLTSLTNKWSSGASKKFIEDFGIGIVDWRVIAMLAVEPNITANRVCQVIGLDKGAVSRCFRHLDTSKLISVKADAEDARLKNVELTSKGLKLHDRVMKIALKREQNLLAGLSEQELNTLIKLFAKLQNNVGDLDAG